MDNRDLFVLAFFCLSGIVGALNFYFVKVSAERRFGPANLQANLVHHTCVLYAVYALVTWSVSAGFSHAVVLLGLLAGGVLTEGVWRISPFMRGEEEE